MEFQLNIRGLSEPHLGDGLVGPTAKSPPAGAGGLRLPCSERDFVIELVLRFRRLLARSLRLGLVGRLFVAVGLGQE